MQFICLFLRVGSVCSQEHVGTCSALIWRVTSMKQRLVEDSMPLKVNQYCFAFVKRPGRYDCLLNTSNRENLIKPEGTMLGEQLSVS